MTNPAPIASTGRIDVHNHVVPPQWRQWLLDLSLTSGGLHIPEWTVDGALELMEKAQIATAILSASTPGVEPASDKEESRRTAREINEFCAQVVTDHPGRFGFWATVTLPDVDGALQEATYALDELNADGVILFANSKGVYLGDPRFDPLLEELDRRGSVVFVHPAELQASPVEGIPPFAADFLLDTTRAAINMVVHRTLERYQNLKVILSHAGGIVPYAADRIAASLTMTHPELAKDTTVAALRRFYFDTALSGSQFTLPSLLAFAEPDHVLFGSDYPYAPSREALWFTSKLDAYEDLDLPAVDRGNAECLLPRLMRD
ncbi:amidohydrolase family protein [Nocardia abscessus]|uniref:amidohydrolase family protein n=1 Tax=Nocardia abscessus TaxID=120957 RepID=UPI00245409D4|nr:amidohydrolase family protein [Nocardia abscessus]